MCWRNQLHSSLQLAKAYIIFHHEEHRALSPALSIKVAEHSTGQGGGKFGFFTP